MSFFSCTTGCIRKCSASIQTGCDIYTSVSACSVFPVHGCSLLSKSSATHHCEEVVIALDLGWHLGELLVKSVRDVVSGISGDDEDALPDCSKLDGQTAAGGGKRRERFVQQEEGSQHSVSGAGQYVYVCNMDDKKQNTKSF